MRYLIFQFQPQNALNFQEFIFAVLSQIEKHVEIITHIFFSVSNSIFHFKELIRIFTDRSNKLMSVCYSLAQLISKSENLLFFRNLRRTYFLKSALQL